MSTRERGVAAIAFAVVVIGLPVCNTLPSTSALHVSNFTLNLFGKFLTYAILALGLDLLWGYAGVLSLGQRAVQLGDQAVPAVRLLAFLLGDLAQLGQILAGRLGALLGGLPGTRGDSPLRGVSHVRANDVGAAVEHRDAGRLLASAGAGRV